MSTTDMVNEAEFENEMKEMSDRQLSEFTARQIVAICKRCTTEDVRITALEGQSKKAFGITGGVSGAVGAAVIAILDFIIKPR